MAKSRKDQVLTGELVQFQSSNEMSVLPPSSGVVGEFLKNTQNMFQARAMRMKTLFGRIDQAGQHMEGLLRTASERADAATSKLEDQLRREGLLAELEPQGENEE